MPVVITAKALKDLKSVPARDVTAILAKLEIFAAHGTGDVKKLQSRDGYRLRHGDWRALFTMDGDVVVIRVLHRREAYD